MHQIHNSKTLRFIMGDERIKVFRRYTACDNQSTLRVIGYGYPILQ